MPNNKLAALPPKAFDLAEALAQTSEQLTPMMQQMATAIMLLDKQVHTLSAILDSRVTISSTQARCIADAVKARARAICEEQTLSYALVGKSLREAIWRSFRAMCGVHSHYDLPEKYYDMALGFIGGWMPGFALIQRLHWKEGAAHE